MFQESWKYVRHIMVDCKLVFRVRKHWPLHFISVTSQLRPASASQEANCRAFMCWVTIEIWNSKDISIMTVTIYWSKPTQTQLKNNSKGHRVDPNLTLRPNWGLTNPRGLSYHRNYTGGFFWFVCLVQFRKAPLDQLFLGSRWARRKPSESKTKGGTLQRPQACKFWTSLHHPPQYCLGLTGYQDTMSCTRLVKVNYDELKSFLSEALIEVTLYSFI